MSDSGLLSYIHFDGTEPVGISTTAASKVILLADKSVPDEWMHELCAKIADTACYYFMSWGTNCEEWHDFVDEAHLAFHNYGDIPDEKHMMTTWHDNEPMRDIFWFCKTCAHHLVHELPSTLIIHITDTAKEEEIKRAYISA
jgi:hypothetical protein